MDKEHYFLVINTGSTSTKAAVFVDEKMIHETKLYFPKLCLRPPIQPNQYLNQIVGIKEFLACRGLHLEEIDCIVARGGLLRPIQSGVYLIDQTMCDELVHTEKQHACNLSALIAMELSKEGHIPAFIVDPPVVDEMDLIAKVTGLAGMERSSQFHALNQKECARKAARDLGKNYSECSLIVAHMGGGITVGVHQCGRVIDVNNGLDGDGPFSPDRTGGLPVCSVLDLVFKQGLSREEINGLIVGKGGLMSYLGTTDIIEIEKMIDLGNEKAGLYLQAMAYQVAREIGACAAVLMGKVDGVVLTGGIAYSKRVTSWISARVEFIAPLLIYPGEDEMAALAAAGYRVMKGIEKATIYPQVYPV